MQLKLVLCYSPVWKLSGLTKPFVVETDAAEMAVGFFLLQH